jgi:hypothetical protein
VTITIKTKAIGNAKTPEVIGRRNALTILPVKITERTQKC